MKKYMLSLALLCGITVSPLYSTIIIEKLYSDPIIKKWHQQKNLKTFIAAVFAGFSILKGNAKRVLGVASATFLMSSALALKVIT